MSRIYTSTNRIKFTDISEKYKVNKSAKGKLSELHAMLITYVSSHFKDTKKYKQQIVDALNIITYAVYANEPLPFDWSPNSPFSNLPNKDSDLIEETLGEVMLTVDSIEWDIQPTYSNDDDIVESVSGSSIQNNPTNKSSKQIRTNVKANNTVNKAKRSETIINPTPKQALYIQPPAIPQFDYSKPWMQGIDGADNLVIYVTLPEVPTKQNEISVTTDLSKLTYRELMNLYPNHVIHTRASIMYQPCDGIELDDDIGLIIPIEGFSRDQIIDNIIKYPHIFKLMRQVDDDLISFYSNIEIDGELYNTLDVWNDLPESKIIPRQSDFVKEYVVRRYLLERDIKKIQHKYPIFGTLDPFLTLFMSPTDYINRGYSDVEQIVKQCVLSRVSYKQSRNPVIRRLNNAELHI